MRTVSKIGISFALAGALALAAHVRGYDGQLAPAAHAANSPEESPDDSCSLASLKGSFGISTTGMIVALGPVGPVGEVGTISFDGTGGVTQITTVSLNGTILSNRVSSGSYVVNEDCTGSLSLALPPPAGMSNSNFVIVDHAKELRLINTGAGRVLTGNAKRQ